MQHDIETAHHAGITSIAVLTGYNDAAQLSKARPDIIVPDLLVLRTLMRRYALPSDTQDSININGLELDTFIGVPEEERASMQTLKADITFYPDEALSGLNDDFSRTVCYDSIARALRAEAMARPRKLVETLAEDMGKVCLKEFGARHVIVTLRKFILPRTEQRLRDGACFTAPGKRGGSLPEDTSCLLRGNVFPVFGEGVFLRLYVAGMAGADGGAVPEVKRIAGDGDVLVNVSVRLGGVRHDLDDGLPALNEGVAGDGHVPDHTGFIPAGGVILHQNGRHARLLKPAPFNQHRLPGGKQEAPGGNVAANRVADVDGGRPSGVLHGVVGLDVPGVGLPQREFYFLLIELFDAGNGIGGVRNQRLAGNVVNPVPHREGVKTRRSGGA